MRIPAILAPATLSLLAGCFPSNVVAVEDRAVVTSLDLVEWRPAAPEEVPGLYVSEQIEGPAAASLGQVSYFFGSDGNFAGAALVLAGVDPEYQVLSGRWELHDGHLVLGGGAPARVEAGGDGLLRLSGEEGTVVLRRQELR